MTSDCIDSIFAKTKGIDFEVILVDNASSDGSKEVFEKDCRVKYVHSNKNLGFGKANNLGYKEATGKYIFLLNSDTLLINNAVYEMYKFMENSPNSYGCVGCVLQNKSGEIIHSYNKKFPNLWWIFQEIITYAIPKSIKLHNPYQKRESSIKFDQFPLTVDQITGADLFIRREAIEECGMFDPDFFMYYEETEMQFRFQKKGYKSVIIDTPKIIHLVGASSSSKVHSLKKFNMNLRSRYIYAKKTFSPFKYLVFRIIQLMLIPRLILSFNSWKEKKDSLKIILG
jgi:hypothetical protein